MLSENTYLHYDKTYCHSLKCTWKGSRVSRLFEVCGSVSDVPMCTSSKRCDIRHWEVRETVKNEPFTILSTISTQHRFKEFSN